MFEGILLFLLKKEKELSSNRCLSFNTFNRLIFRFHTVKKKVSAG